MHDTKKFFSLDDHPSGAYFKLPAPRAGRGFAPQVPEDQSLSLHQSVIQPLLSHSTFLKSKSRYKNIHTTLKVTKAPWIFTADVNLNRDLLLSTWTAANFRTIDRPNILHFRIAQKKKKKSVHCNGRGHAIDSQVSGGSPAHKLKNPLLLLSFFLRDAEGPLFSKQVLLVWAISFPLTVWRRGAVGWGVPLRK